MTIHPEAYIVRKDDTLWSIATMLYGAQSRWQDLAQLNTIADPAELRTGTSLRVPAADLRCHPVRYRTKRYDTFYELASERLGNHRRWPDLANLNQVKPFELPAGIEINVPPDFRH
jgi:nucleoid-associated protein YgaU